ncbi:MAG TPA: hypothetical protein VMH61_05650 [Candidatus Acidoferrales bacterium]|nr:hypothetical protein [Candidatus Acidoferrales bacterium]
MTPAARALAPLAAIPVLIALAGLPACTRRTQLVPASADSARAPVDSFAVHARQAADHWESGLDDEAAALSARVVREALEARPGAPWVERARGVLDSLGIAAEVAGGDPMIVTNLFSRTDPDGDSWPYLLWREKTGVRFQRLECHGLRLTDATTRGFGPASIPTDSAEAAVIWGRRVAGGLEPQLMVWRYARGGRWDLVQTLGADSLGGTGVGEFANGDTLQQLITRTYRPTPYFDECPTCPHVLQERRFDWSRAGFVRVDEQAVPSPYATFTAFIAALAANDPERAAQYVVDRSLIPFANRFEWNVPSRGRWRVAPATDESAIEMVVLRGANEAFRVRFEARDRDWLIAGFEPTTRSIE